MIKPDWEIFSAKFSSNKELIFEWFSYLLFCREFNLPKGWFGFKNQSGIEKNPIKYNGEIIGFQSKFYSTSLSTHKDELIETLNKVKRDYPELTKLLFYTNQIWSQAHNNIEKKMTPPQALVDIENKAKELGISLEWKEASFFESEFVCLEHDDLSKYFFTEQAQHGWQRFDDWSNTKAEIEAEYYFDDNVKVISPNHQQNNELNVVDGINEIRQKLSSTGTSVRLIGLSGVGKTRFAQALFDERIGENSLDHRNVWYCDLGDSPIPMPEHFIEELIQKNKPYILIVDNCGQDTHANLTRKVQNTQIALMTIEYDVKDDLPERTDVYKLKPISVEIVQKVIERHYSHIHSLNSRKIAEFAGGNYRLALAIASNIERTDNLALLTDKELFERLFWQQDHVDKELLKVAQNFALVYSFNIEDSGEEKSELDFLAGLARVDADIAIEAIENLKNKDIVQQRGKWRAILPHALANHLAKELISTKLVHQIDQFTKRMPARLQTSFIKRLSYLHDVPKAKELVELWFSHDGWLGEKLLNDTYDNLDLVKIRLLSSIAEDQLLALIEQKHTLDDKFLTRKNPHFFELSRLIRSLAYQKHNFKNAFQLLVYLIKDKKNDEKNSSTHYLITSLFKLYTSETLANLEQKKEILNKLKSQEQYLSLLLACISKALNFHQSGYFIREPNESGKSSDFGYHPKNLEEIHSWVDFLLETLNELDIQGVIEARSIFANYLKEIIWTCKQTQIVKKYIDLFNSRKYFIEAHNKILNIIEINSEMLKNQAPHILKDLNNIEINLRPNKYNINQLLQSYVFVSENTLLKLTKNPDKENKKEIPDFSNYKDLIEYISIHLQKIDILKENIELLIKAHSGWVENNYLVKLGSETVKGFSNYNQCINILNIANIDNQLYFSEFLLGILQGFKIRSLNDYHNILEFLINNKKFKNMVFLLILQSSENDNDFKYFSQIILSNRIKIIDFPNLSANKSCNKITQNQFKILLDALIEAGENKKVLYELSQECFYKNKLEKKYINILLNNLEEIIFSDHLSDHIEDIYNTIINSDKSNLLTFFKVAQNYFEREKYIHINEHDKNFKILKLLITRSTTNFINFFCEDKKFIQKFLFGDLVKILIYANEEDVLNWIKHDQIKLKFWIENSSLLIFKDNNYFIWIDLIKDLLNVSKIPSQTLEDIIQNNVFEIKGNIVYTGTSSDILKHKIPYLKSLKDKLKLSHPQLLPIIDIKERELLKMIEIQSKKDDEELRMSNERFDW